MDALMEEEQAGHEGDKRTETKARESDREVVQKEQEELDERREGEKES